MDSLQSPVEFGALSKPSSGPGSKGFSTFTCDSQSSQAYEVCSQICQFCHSVLSRTLNTTLPGMGGPVASQEDPWFLGFIFLVMGSWHLHQHRELNVVLLTGGCSHYNQQVISGIRCNLEGGRSFVVQMVSPFTLGSYLISSEMKYRPVPHNRRAMYNYFSLVKESEGSIPWLHLSF